MKKRYTAVIADLIELTWLGRTKSYDTYQDAELAGKELMGRMGITESREIRIMIMPDDKA